MEWFLCNPCLLDLKARGRKAADSEAIPKSLDPLEYKERPRPRCLAALHMAAVAVAVAVAVTHGAAKCPMRMPASLSMRGRRLRRPPAR